MLAKQIAVGQHCALRTAGGATGVLQYRYVSSRVLVTGVPACPCWPLARSLNEIAWGRLKAGTHLLTRLDTVIDQYPLKTRQHIAHAALSNRYSDR